MTLIAAWRCPNGIVMHADSQETVSLWNEDIRALVEYRKTVQKITPEQMGQFQVIVAGSGPGELIDSFLIRLKRACDNDTSADIGDFVEITERTLADFYAVDVRLSTISEDQKSFKLMIAAFSPATGDYNAWLTANVTLCPIQSLELAGWEEPLYVNIAKRLYAPDMSIPQAVLAGVYLLTIGEATSNYIKDPYSIAVIHKDGISMESSENVLNVQKRLQSYEEKINRVFLDCADTTISVSDLENSLSDFSKVALALHRQHINDILTWENIFPADAGRPYRKYPTPAVISGDVHGRVQFEHDPEKRDQKLREFQEVKQGLFSTWHMIKCQNCSLELEYMITVSVGPENRTLFCPNCKKPNRTCGSPVRFRSKGESRWTEILDSMQSTGQT